MRQANSQSRDPITARANLEANLLPVEGHQRDLAYHASALYYDSANSSAHAEGPHVVEAILRYVGWLREDGMRRLDDHSMINRLSKLIELCGEIFDQHQEINSVVYYGSALRGKPLPGDHDLKIIPDLSQAPDSDMLSANLKPLLSPHRIDRAKIEFGIADHPDEIGIVNTGPYLVIARQQSDPTNSRAYRAFFNWAAEEWKETR